MADWWRAICSGFKTKIFLDNKVSFEKNGQQIDEILRETDEILTRVEHKSFPPLASVAMAGWGNGSVGVNVGAGQYSIGIGPTVTQTPSYKLGGGGGGNWNTSIAAGTGGPTGAIGPTFGAQKPILPPLDIHTLNPVMRQHRRLYVNEIDRLSGQSSLMMNLARNRIILRVQQNAFRSDADDLIEQYVEWLDDHNDGLYTLEKSSSAASLVISFEIEADMIQFSLAFR